MSAVAQKQKQKAVDFLAEADKLLNKKSWFSSGKERNAEEAAELMMQAANAYKVGGFNQEAGETYMKAGELHRDKLSNNNEAAKCFSQAGKKRRTKDDSSLLFHIGIDKAQSSRESNPSNYIALCALSPTGSLLR
jgi:hypothetical protein